MQVDTQLLDIRKPEKGSLLGKPNRRERPSLGAFLQALVWMSSLFVLGACAHHATPGVTRPSSQGPGALLTKDTVFQVNTRVFLVKKPKSISGLQPYYNGEEAQTHVLSAADGKALVAALERSWHAKSDESGSVSTRTVAGQPAVYEATRELIYPVEFDPPQLSKSPSRELNGAFPVAPAHPVTFESRNCGFQSQVTPIVTAKGELEVRLKMESTTFDGFVNYGSPITTAGKNWFGQPVPVVLTENRIEMPVFTTGKVESQVSANPNDYIVITGLPQGRPLNAALTKADLLSNEPISSTEARKPYQLVATCEILVLAE